MLFAYSSAKAAFFWEKNTLKKPTSRRRFIQKAALGSAAALVACGKAQESGGPALQTQRHFKWKMVTTWPKDFPGLGTGANRLAKSEVAVRKILSRALAALAARLAGYHTDLTSDRQ